MSYGHRVGPNVSIPSSWHRNAHVQRPVGHAAGLPGYSSNHVLYGIEREHWAKKAYASPPAETISLEISAVREGGNKRKGGRGVAFGVCNNLDSSCLRIAERLTHLEHLRG
jgi:hypothetical protein